MFIYGTCDPTKSLENLFGIYKRNKECGDKPNKLGNELLLCVPLYIYIQFGELKKAFIYFANINAVTLSNFGVSFERSSALN